MQNLQVKWNIEKTVEMAVDNGRMWKNFHIKTVYKLRFSIKICIDEPHHG